MAVGTETVLLVEDDAAVRAVAGKALLRFGHTVLSAESGEDAVRLARNFQGRIHLLLTDIMMPGMTGLEIAARVTRFRPGIRVFFMSGFVDEDLVRQGLLDPDTQLLQKPFSPEELSTRVRAILDLPPRAEVPGRHRGQASPAGDVPRGVSGAGGGTRSAVGSARLRWSSCSTTAESVCPRSCLVGELNLADVLRLD